MLKPFIVLWNLPTTTVDKRRKVNLVLLVHFRKTGQFAQGNTDTAAQQGGRTVVQIYTYRDQKPLSMGYKTYPTSKTNRLL